MKLLKRIHLLILPLFFVLPTNATTKKNSDLSDKLPSDSDVCLLNTSCDDQILDIGSVVYFPSAYTVDDIDIARQMVYNNVIGAWIPSYHLTEVVNIGGWPSDVQLLDYGDLFVVTMHYNQGESPPNCFRVNAYYIPHNTVQINFRDEYGNVYPTWVYAAPLTETCNYQIDFY